MKKRIWASVSGGLTSMMMARLIQESHPPSIYDVRFIFANTGQEHDKTLEFVDRCDREWGLGVVWLESVTHRDSRTGCTHRIVSFETASRNGEPFEQMIEKYGIPNKSYPHCNRELKLNPMRSYIRSIGWQGVQVAVGIRADEPRRLRKDAERDNIVYPMAHWWPLTKADVLDWWEDQPFSLGIEEREGNCKWCWKKSEKKHFANIASNPEWYDFPRRMEQMHSETNRPGSPQVFFRGALSTDLLFKHFEAVNFDPRYLARVEETGGCSESCEAFSSPEGAAEKYTYEPFSEECPHCGAEFDDWYEWAEHSDFCEEKQQ